METITDCAIIWNGKLYTRPRPSRHSDIIHGIHEETGALNIFGLQGFMTSEGRFVERPEAAKIAGASKQIKYNKRNLFSEDLW